MLIGDGSIDSLYNISAYPTSYLINKEGVIIYRYTGGLNEFAEKELEK
ncbi:MAG: hypothetical protein LBL90_08880 [Prevotellaceae bacterium]|nr:hypothetical protein [Prevotellaceae bacterium]